MNKYKHIEWNPMLQDWNWVFKQVDDTWSLSHIVPVSVLPDCSF
jgi:hypothetical protein